MKFRRDSNPELVKKVQFMRTIPFFDGFSEDDLYQTAEMSSWLKFTQGETIVREGDVGSTFWILLKGSVNVVKVVPGDPAPYPLAVIPQGECFGEMSLISGEPRTADVMARDEVFLFKVDAGRLNAASVSLQLKFYKKFAFLLVQRLTRTSQQFAPKR